ncbi:unannotated protein [freshwater metagenome]|uniref:Unannotated protein n=1 Tax=freshwater metagenome TaxID=449393 RepID=A0A6J7I9I4_9ZZZZ
MPPERGGARPVGGVGVHLGGGDGQGGVHRVQGDVHLPPGRVPVRVGAGRDRLGQRCGDPVRAAGPDRGDPDAAVPEPRPVQVGPRPAERGGGDVVELDISGVAADHGRGRPAARARRRAGRGQVDQEQPSAVVGVRGDQRGGARPGAGAPLLGAGQHPPAVRAAGLDPAGRGLGGPDPQPLPRGRCGAAQLGEDRDGVGVALGQPGQRQVPLAEVAEGGPALRGAACPRQRRGPPVVEQAGQCGGGPGDAFTRPLDGGHRRQLPGTRGIRTGCVAGRSSRYCSDETADRRSHDELMEESWRSTTTT